MQGFYGTVKDLSSAILLTINGMLLAVLAYTVTGDLVISSSILLAATATFLVLARQASSPPSVTSVDIRPPRLAQRLFRHLLPKSIRDDLIGDLEEEYHIICCNRGEWKARGWYYGQVIASLWFFFLRIGESVWRIIS